MRYMEPNFSQNLEHLRKSMAFRDFCLVVKLYLIWPLARFAPLMPRENFQKQKFAPVITRRG